MKPQRPFFSILRPGARRLLAVFLVQLGGQAFAQSGGDYVLKKTTIDGGGGAVTGGDYQLTGTLGQPDAEQLEGGDYVLRGGFWSPETMQDVPVSPIPDPIDKCRFISWIYNGIGTNAVRVVLTSLHHVEPPYTGGPSVPFTSFEGQVRWVGPPASYVESTASGTPFMAAELQCTPHYQDWSTVGLLHVTGSAVVPSSLYRVEVLAQACQGQETAPHCLPGGSLVSAPLQVRTTRWGDMETPFNPPSPTVQPDLGDVSALVNKFRGQADAPIKARALLVGNDAQGNVEVGLDFSFIHIAGCVDAFRGRPYPHTIEACP